MTIWHRWSCLLVCAGTLFGGTVLAEMRVLIAFDESGHHLHRQVFIDPGGESNQILFARHKQRNNVVAAVDQISVHWIDANGAELDVTNHTDPRVVHAPPDPGASIPSLVAVYKGAYLIQGPDSAVQLLINLPERTVPPLSAEQWTLDLPSSL